MKKGKLMIKVRAIKNGYGFGYNWILVISKNGKKRKKREFYLGQDCKVCLRALGMEMRELGNIIKIRFNTPYVLFSRQDINRFIGILILLSMYGIEADLLTEDLESYLPTIEKDLFKRQSWELSVE